MSNFETISKILKIIAISALNFGVDLTLHYLRIDSLKI